MYSTGFGQAKLPMGPVQSVTAATTAVLPPPPPEESKKAFVVPMVAGGLAAILGLVFAFKK
jgi:hypothetical protein